MSRLKKARQVILRFTGQFVLYNLINVLCKSLRITYINSETVNELLGSKNNFILAFWHGTMLLPWYIHRNQNFAALISKSKDGDLLAKILRNWKYEVIRGSSSKGGNVALGIMVDYAKSGYCVSVTPDGPRGPAFEMKAGAVIAAKKSGLPLIVAGVGFNKKKELKSWDHFQVPALFSKAKIVYSDPIYIDAELGYDETSLIIKKCEKDLIRLQNEAMIF